MEARQRVEFIGGNCVVATIDQMGSAYYEAGGTP
jgi:hypothetical protein